LEKKIFHLLEKEALAGIRCPLKKIKRGSVGAYLGGLAKREEKTAG
jgi:hypothetical protein